MTEEPQPQPDDYDGEQPGRFGEDGCYDEPKREGEAIDALTDWAVKAGMVVREQAHAAGETFRPVVIVARDGVPLLLASFDGPNDPDKWLRMAFAAASVRATEMIAVLDSIGAPAPPEVIGAILEAEARGEGEIPGLLRPTDNPAAVEMLTALIVKAGDPTVYVVSAPYHYAPDGLRWDDWTTGTASTWIGDAMKMMSRHGDALEVSPLAMALWLETFAGVHAHARVD